MVQLTTDNSYGTWRFCAWNGMIFMGVFIVFWGIMGHNVPPYGGDMDASVIANYFRDNANLVRLGMAISMTFAVSYAVWGISIGKVMDYILGRDHILTNLQVWGAGLTVVPILVSSSFWLTGSYRPEALPDEILQLLYDMAWLLIDLAYSVTSVQMIALGVGCLRDKRAQPFFPKWVCWYSIWVGFMFVAEILMPMFKSGAFARQGILNFWIEFMIFFIYAPIITFYQLKAIKRIEAGEPAA
ncbi:MAG: hypothetical protein H6915_04675 [Novosphingobium sp.]|nr:hypothetical protein [Novosphingobium sp.]MCP5389040.1 hypothetical protein [Novosphingobium sp.]